MPRYSIDMFDHFVALDDEGQELPDTDAVRTLVRETLASRIKDEENGRPSIQFRADVRDESGHDGITAHGHRRSLTVHFAADHACAD